MRTILLRIIGALHLLYGLAGVCYFAVMLCWHLPMWSGRFRTLDWAVFIVLSSLSLSLCLLLGYFGLRLVQGDESIIPTSVALFVGEIVYALLNVVAFWMIPSISMSSLTIGFWQFAEGPLVPQLITGYPLWGIALLTILWKFPNLFRSTGWI